MIAFMKRAGVTRRESDLIQAYVAQGKPVPVDVARQLTTRYEANLLKLRGERIARTELLGSLHHAQDEGLMQIIEGGHLRTDQVVRTWDSSEDGDTRPSHRAMEGQQRRLGEAFVSGDGFRLLYPGDRSLGAPAKEVINCRCKLNISIDFLADLAA